MERLGGINLVTMATMFIFLLVSATSVLARPHIRPRLTLADLDADGAIPKNDAFDIDLEDEVLLKEELGGIQNAIRFDAVDLPSHFETYDLNRDRKISLNELSIVSGTKEIDASGPFSDADLNHDQKISFEEFKRVPWIFGGTHEVEEVDLLIQDLVGDDF